MNNRNAEFAGIYRPGDQIGGEFLVKRVCGGPGRSGMGIVYIVEGHGNCFAMKSIQPSLMKSQSARNAIQREAMLWLELGHHPYIVHFDHHISFGSQFFIGMEYIQPDERGRTDLADYLDGAPLDLPLIVRWSLHICRAMAFANQHGLACHGDLKPNNILISHPGRTAKLTDFGLARAAREAAQDPPAGTSPATSVSATFSGGRRIVGTPMYMAPEQLRGVEAGIRSDIYAFGLILWQMTSGHPTPPLLPPWKNDLEDYVDELLRIRSASQGPMCPENPLCKVISRCLRTDSADRWESFAELYVNIIAEILGRATSALLDSEIALAAAQCRKEMDACIGACPGSTLSAEGSANEDQLSKEAERLATLGWSYWELGKLSDALQCLRRGRRLDPGSAMLWSYEGVVLTDLGRSEEALNALQKAVELTPGDAGHWQNRGRALRKFGRTAEALESFRKAAELAPLAASPWESVGNCHRDLGQNENAVRAYQQALAADPNRAEVWNSLAKAQLAMGLYEQSLQSCRRAVALDPLDSGFKSLLEMILARKNQ